MARGGDRNGRRPTLPPEQRRVKVAYMVDPATKERIKAESEQQGVSQGKVLDELMELRVKIRQILTTMEATNDAERI